VAVVSAAAHPLTTVRNVALLRAAPRIPFRSSTSASAVTAQLLKTAASASDGSSTMVPPAPCTSARTCSLSYWLARQP
jgi:hypothetical protein